MLAPGNLQIFGGTVNIFGKIHTRCKRDAKHIGSQLEATCRVEAGGVAWSAKSLQACFDPEKCIL